MDWTSAVRDHLDYDGFGNTTESNPTVGDRYAYTGREHDTDTGLQYNRARYYDPKTGRWTSEDPIGFNAGDGNLYRYVGNDTVNNIDPFGHNRWPSWVKRLIGRPDPNGGPATVDDIISVHHDRSHKGGRHYDVTYRNSRGKTITKRFWPDGKPLTPAENRALSRGRRPRRGNAKLGAIAALGVTTIICGGVEVVYDHYLEVGEKGALKKGTGAFIGRHIRAILHAGELPEVYTKYGVVGQRYFIVYIKGRTIRVWLEPLPGGGFGIHATENGEVLIRAVDCPLSGL
jgi:RHS repeat-associated protein